MHDAARRIGRPQRCRFAFAKRHGVLVQRRARRHRRVRLPRRCARRSRSPRCAAICGVPVKLEKVEDEDFDALLRLAYEGGRRA